MCLCMHTWGAGLVLRDIQRIFRDDSFLLTSAAGANPVGEEEHCRRPQQSGRAGL